MKVSFILSILLLSIVLESCQRRDRSEENQKKQNGSSCSCFNCE